MKNIYQVFGVQNFPKHIMFKHVQSVFASG